MGRQDRRRDGRTDLGGWALGTLVGKVVSARVEELVYMICSECNNAFYGWLVVTLVGKVIIWLGR